MYYNRRYKEWIGDACFYSLVMITEEKCFFLKMKKENKIEEFNYEGFTTWFNKILQKSLPENTKA